MDFHDELKLTMHKYLKHVYIITKKFPKDEIYGLTSQLRRAALSIILNYIEGFARRTGNNCKVYKNFLRTSFGSLKESKYLLFFSNDLKYIADEDYKIGLQMADKIGKMIYSLIN